MKHLYTEQEIGPLLEQLLDDKETGVLEFKSAKGGFPGSFWETYSSFANTHGGTIVLGVKETKDGFSLDGLSKTQTTKYRKIFFDTVHNPNKVNRSLLKDDDIQEVEFDGAFVLFFYIPQTQASVKPVYVGADPYRGTFRRDWEGDYLCSPEEVSSMFADANPSQPRDAKIMEGYGIEDLDMNSVGQYRILFDRANPDHVWGGLTTEEFLRKLNVIRKDRKTKEEGLTMAGLLMFGTYSAITEGLPNFFPDYQEKEPDGERWINRICPDGNWESNLFQFYRRVLPILQGFLPKPFELEGNLRKGETSANVAVREAFTNSLIHADYTINASLNVYKYPNAIEFSNPGTLLISLDQYYQGGESVCRNKTLQTMFTFLGSSEKAGSGTDKIMRGWDDQNWKRPRLFEKARPNKVVLAMVMESLMDESVMQSLRKEHGDIIDNLQHSELTVLALVHTEEQINNDRLRSALGIHRADITALLGTMVHEGLLEPHGYGRGRTYSAKGFAPIGDSSVALNGVTSASNGVTSASNGVTSAANGVTSAANGVTSARNMDTSDCNMDTSALKGGHLDPERWTPQPRKVDTSMEVLPKRMSKKQMKEALVSICTDWTTPEDIASKLGRTLKHIKKILPENQDVLEMKYGNNPHHPAQKYRVRRDDDTII